MKPSFYAFLAFSGLATAAYGHTPLASSTPADKASVAAPVKELALQFGGDVRLTAVALVDASGAKKAVDDLPTAVAAKFSLAIRDELAPGDYTVTWRAVGADTHVISGEIHFTVTPQRSH